MKTECTGGRNCPLEISKHPKGPGKFALGCSLCRSEKLEEIVREPLGGGGFNIEKRNDLLHKHGHIDVNLDERMNVIRGRQQPQPPQPRPGIMNRPVAADKDQ